MPYTLRDISDLIATSDSRPEEPVFNQLKGLAGRGILQPYADQYGKKGSLLFPASEVFRARMLLAAIDNGFSSDKLAAFDAQMRAQSAYSDPISGQIMLSFEQAVADLSTPSPRFWVFEVAQVRIEGELSFSGHWTIDGARFAAPNWFELPQDGIHPYPDLEAVNSFAFSYLCGRLHHAMNRDA